MGVCHARPAREQSLYIIHVCIVVVTYKYIYIYIYIILSTSIDNIDVESDTTICRPCSEQETITFPHRFWFTQSDHFPRELAEVHGAATRGSQVPDAGTCSHEMMNPGVFNGKMVFFNGNIVFFNGKIR